MKFSYLISVTEAAKFLKISKETVYRMLDRNELPHYRVGKLYKFLPVELMRHFKNNRVKKPNTARR